MVPDPAILGDRCLGAKVAERSSYGWLARAVWSPPWRIGLREAPSLVFLCRSNVRLKWRGNQTYLMARRSMKAGAMKTAMTVKGSSARTLEPHRDASAADDPVVVFAILTRSHHRGCGTGAAGLRTFQGARQGAGFATAVSFMIPAFAHTYPGKIREFI
jgi:hypothetical protein